MIRNARGEGNVTDVKQREYDKACSRLPLSMKHLHALMCHAMYTQQRLYRNVLCMQYNTTPTMHTHTLLGAWEAVRDF